MRPRENQKRQKSKKKGKKHDGSSRSRARGKLGELALHHASLETNRSGRAGRARGRGGGRVGRGSAVERRRLLLALLFVGSVVCAVLHCHGGRAATTAATSLETFPLWSLPIPAPAPPKKESPHPLSLSRRIRTASRAKKTRETKSSSKRIQEKRDFRIDFFVFLA